MQKGECVRVSLYTPAHFFSVGNIFISNTRLKSAKNQANSKQHTEADYFCYLKNILILHPCYHPKMIGQKKAKQQVCLF